MRITLEGPNPPSEFSSPRVVIELDGDDLDIHQIFENLIEPALVAFGFSRSTVEAGLLEAAALCDLGDQEKETE